MRAYFNTSQYDEAYFKNNTIIAFRFAFFTTSISYDNFQIQQVNKQGETAYVVASYEIDDDPVTRGMSFYYALVFVPGIEVEQVHIELINRYQTRQN